jgi:endonuclease-3 related protein
VAKEDPVLTIYHLLYRAFGPQHWWPGDGPFEMMVGAILTQNTAWSNVEKAIKNLKKENLLTVRGLHEVPLEKLEALVHPAGYYRIKSRRLKSFIRFLWENYQEDFPRMWAEDTEALREKLLSVNGVGRETADSILLYAGGKPTFVVDSYTHRIFTRHQLVPEDVDYEGLRSFFLEHLPDDPALYNEYHALIVRAGKTYCRKTPRCEGCPMEGMMES